MKKLLSLVLALMMVISAIPALAEEEPTKLTWFVDVPTFNFASEGWGLDDTTTHITELFGIEIEFVAAADTSGSQLSALISGEDYPDLLTVEGLWNAEDTNLLKQMAQADLLISYNELAEQYLTEEEWKTNFRQDVIGWYAIEDGLTYAYPNYAYSVDDIDVSAGGLTPNRHVWARHDMLAQLGIDIPLMGAWDVKWDEFLNVAERAMTEIGDYNGMDIIGLQLYEKGNEAVGIIENYFAVPWETEEGDYYQVWGTEAYKEVYQFLNEAYRRGLILDANYTDIRDMVNEKIANGRVFAFIGATQDFGSPLATLYDSDPEAYYVPVILRNMNGDDPTLQDISGWGYLQTAISALNPNLEGTIKMVNWLCSPEGALYMNKGVEGVHWQYDENGDIESTDEWIAIKTEDPSANRKAGIGAFDLFANYAFLMNYNKEPNPDDPNYMRTICLGDYGLKYALRPYSYRDVNYKSLPGDERELLVSEENTKLSSYMELATAELLTAPSAEEFEAKYAEIIATRPTLANLDLINEYNNDRLWAAKKALNVQFFFPPYQEAYEAAQAE